MVSVVHGKRLMCLNMDVLFTIQKTSNGPGVRVRLRFKNRCCSRVSFQNSSVFVLKSICYLNMLNVIVSHIPSHN